MKKYALLLALLLTLTVTGCRKRDDQPPEEENVPPVEQEEPPVEQGPLCIETLRVELSRDESDTQLVLRAARELPELLKTYFAEASGDVEIGQVYVTVGTATAATAQSLAEGNVDLAFLPAEDYVLYGQKSAVLLADAPQPQIVPDGDSTVPADWNGQEKRYHTTNTIWEGGTASLICTAPTEYGRQLTKRAASGTALSWKELDNARWGVLASNSDGGYRCANLYLADNYDGRLLSDLSSVTVYDSYQDLLRAAAAEEIDVLVLRKDTRIDVADAWMLERSRISQRGVSGFGRQEPIWEEVSCVAVTEPLYTAVAAVPAEQEDLLAEPFQTALRSVLKRLNQEEPELMGVLGSPRFAPVEDEGLDALRRTLTIEGRTA